MIYNEKWADFSSSASLLFFDFLCADLILAASYFYSLLDSASLVCYSWLELFSPDSKHTFCQFLEFLIISVYPISYECGCRGDGLTFELIEDYSCSSLDELLLDLWELYSGRLELIWLEWLDRLFKLLFRKSVRSY